MGKFSAGSVALVLVATTAMAGMGLVAAQDEPESPRSESPVAPVSPISDHELGLAKGSVFDVPSPLVPVRNGAAPGDLPPAGRAFPGAPPRVPHTVDDFLPITREENWCVDCHALDWTAPGAGDPTAIPVSHFVNLRGDTDEIGGRIRGARWVCVTCHVADTEAAPLVGNSYGR